MREIKFRAWNTNDNVMEYMPSLYWFGENGVTDIPGTSKYIIEQYTGLRDKNGREIYEGDILLEGVYRPVKIAFETDRVGSCGCCFPEFTGSGFVAYDVMVSRCEIIGNIHENPELLNV